MGIATDIILIDNDLYSLVLTSTILSMVLTPLVSGQTARIYALKKRWFRHEKLETSNIPDPGYNKHAVIVGGGRVGFQIAQTLSRLGLPFVILEIDHRRFEKANETGMPVVYGDASQEIVFEATGASVVGVVRKGKLNPNLDAGFILMPEDLVAIIGNEKNREEFCFKAVLSY